MAREPGTRGAGGFWDAPPKNRSRQPRLSPQGPPRKLDYTKPGAHAAVPYGQPGYKPVDAGAPRPKRADKPLSADELLARAALHAVGDDVVKKAANPRVAALSSVLGGVTGIPYTVDALRSGDAAGVALGILGFLPPGRVGRGARAAVEAVEAGESAAGVARAYKPRMIRHNDLEVQAQKPRSRIAQAGLKAADKASERLQGTRAAEVPGVRLATSAERVTKQAGRAQRLARDRATAAQSEALHTIRAIKPGSVEDQANYWYAQLPASHRNAEGLKLVRAKQAEHLEYVTSGRALEKLTADEQALNAKIAQTDDAEEKFRLIGEREQVQLAKADLPAQVQDTSASLAVLDRLIAEPPPVNQTAIDAAHALSNERTQIVTEAGRLHPERAATRRGLVARWVGLEPSGEEAYIGHRGATPDTRFPWTPKGGTGRVKSPQGVGSENKLELARTGRLRQSLHVAVEDWQSAQVFRESMQARDDLGRLGTGYAGHVPEGSVVVNPKARVIPASWKTDELAQFQEGYEDVDEIRRQAEEIVREFIAATPTDVEAMLRKATEEGVDWSELRVVPKRLVDRYYAQYRPSKARGGFAKGYDTAVDAVAASIVFARVGYIPKNIVQNVVMAVPHQGPLLLRNAVYAAQLLRDPEIRPLLVAEIGHGATAQLGQEALHRKAIGAAARIVTPVADVPLRATAFVHEAAAHGILPKTPRLLNEQDRQRFLRFLTSPKDRPLLNDVHWAANEAMADFTRLTPDQARVARRILIVPGWLMAGTRYPFHFAATHPIRSALLAYLAAGEPGAPDYLQFNRPVDEYFTGSSYRRGIQVGDKRLRTASLSPVSTPWELARGVAGSVQGKTGPYDYETETASDSASPLLDLAIRISNGEVHDWKKELERLFPGGTFLRDEIVGPHPTNTYPDDGSRLGRFEREVGVVPVRVNDPGETRRGGFWGESPGKKKSGGFWDR